LDLRGGLVDVALIQDSRTDAIECQQRRLAVLVDVSEIDASQFCQHERSFIPSCVRPAPV
jgi:hypothetical protein